MSDLDAVVVGSGPNGLTAAATLAAAGLTVRVVEAAERWGGGTRTAPLTEPGYQHDVCAAVHPMGFASPAFHDLRLEDHGLRWIHPPASVAHPLPGDDAVLLVRDLADTARDLGPDQAAYRRLVGPFAARGDELIRDVLRVPGVPSAPLLMARFGLQGIRSAVALSRARFEGPRARALLAGCAAHSILPLERAVTGGVGLVFLVTAHLADWPIAAGGSQAIADALVSVLRSHGGTIETSRRVRTMADLPAARAYLFDLAPRQLVEIAGDRLPARYVARLERYRYGPGVCKVDWALSEPIPWTDPRCLRASTVHLGGTLDDIARAEAAVHSGRHAERPFVLIAQQSLFDPSRAPAGRHTGWAYCHVPAGSDRDVSSTIENRIEEAAPGFKETIQARFTRTARDLEAYNPAYVGGAITGGVADLRQTLARPVASLDPYRTPNPRLFLCSASTPPGGGVHGMCGFRAAQSVLRKLH